MIGIGIDTGGTYTDAVVYDMDRKKILCSGKALTTKSELEKGITEALDMLEPDYVKKAELLALSTTLATNACLEDKGSRAKLLMIGMNPEAMGNLEVVYASYGFHDLSQLVFIDGKPEHIFQEPEEPDWEALKRRIPKEFRNCAAAGVVQIYPQADGGKLEKKAKAILEDQIKIPVTTAYDMFDELDVLKRGAGTLLNARLIPLIAEFLAAVKHVMKDRGLDIPIAIMRSDGSLMSEGMAKDYPVETLLSGPAASVVGGSVMAKTSDAVIVDMGGTTTDVALIRGRQPVTAEKGISIGKWRTTVHGLYVDTFLLGGDSAVRFNDKGMFLDLRRVIPISLLAQRHPEVTVKLRGLAEQHRSHTRMLSEFYVLQKDIGRGEGYTREERRICSALKKAPLMAEELAERLGTDIYGLRTERLEAEGVLMRSGLTPTDMMVVKGDFPVYSPDAALAAIEFLAENVPEEAEEIPEKIYRLVEKKLYCNIVRILLKQKYPGKEKVINKKSVQELIEWSYEDAVNGKKGDWISLPVRSELPIVGVGAPIHIFLPRVARLLGTEAIINENASVANAVGAIASQIVTKVQLHVKAEYDGAELKGYSVYEGSEQRMFAEYPEAEKLALKLAEQQVLDKSRRQGASGSPQVKISVKKLRLTEDESSVFFESIVEAVATDQFQISAGGSRSADGCS